MRRIVASAMLLMLCGTAQAQTIGNLAPPANYIGTDQSGVLAGVIGCDKSAYVDATVSGASQLVALVSGKSIYVCGFDIEVPSSSIELGYGTGTNCATGYTRMTPAWTQSRVNVSPFWRGLMVPAGNALCAKSASSIVVKALVYYTQF